MSLDPNSATKAGKKSKRGPAKKERPSIKDKMEILYEKLLDDLLVNQEKLTKTKSLRDQFTIKQLKEIKNKEFSIIFKKFHFLN